MAERGERAEKCWTFWIWINEFMVICGKTVTSMTQQDKLVPLLVAKLYRSVLSVDCLEAG
jgi:hypothetical protein